MENRFTNIIQLVRAVAPESVGNLNPPAGPDQIAKLAETAPGAPKELVALLEVHNGEEPISWISVLPNGMQLMNVASILQFLAYQTSTPDDFIEDIDELVADNVMDRPQGPVKPVFSYSKRVPFAQLNGNVIWYLDLDPAAGGRAGQVVEEDAESLRLRVIADSLNHLFEKYAQDIRNGAFHTNDQGQIVTDEEWPNQPLKATPKSGAP